MRACPEMGRLPDNYLSRAVEHAGPAIESVTPMEHGYTSVVRVFVSPSLPIGPSSMVQGTQGPTINTGLTRWQAMVTSNMTDQEAMHFNPLPLGRAHLAWFSLYQDGTV